VNGKLMIGFDLRVLPSSGNDELKLVVHWWDCDSSPTRYSSPRFRSPSPARTSRRSSNSSFATNRPKSW